MRVRTNIKRLIFANLLFLITAFAQTNVDADQNTSIPEGPYLGQKPPGLTPEVFAPDIVSINGRFEGAISFSPDLREMYFGATNSDEQTGIYFSKLESNIWTPIKEISFTKGQMDEELHPFVSPDGKRIYFSALSADIPNPKIWYVNRFENSWSNAIKLDSPINDENVFYPNQSKNGDLHYFSLSKFKTYCAPYTNGRFSEVKELEIKSGHHAFVSSSQDYLVVTARSKEAENREDNDVYVHFKRQDGTWTGAINLGTAVNSHFNEKSPSISPDGKYLFFGRDERDIEPGLSNIYWVSTEIIDRLRPDDLRN